MWAMILIPFLVQAAAIGWDEFHFHVKRGLPKWERIGHPLDTLSVLACLAFPLIVPFSLTSLKIYIALGVLSCLLVTKDEFVHKHHCPASEQWLHALLFINHPVMIVAAGCIWGAISMQKLPLWLQPLLHHGTGLRLFLIGQCFLTAVFLSYQIIYWNFIWKEKNE